MASDLLFEKYGRNIESGKLIFRENEEGDRMFIIQEGKVRISKEIDGKEHILAVLEKGDFFGEMALVTNTRRTASATAVGEVRLLAFDRQGFQSMVEKNSRIALNVIDKLCRRLQHANLQIQHLVRNNEKNLIALNLYYAFAEKDKEVLFLLYDRTVEEIALNLALPGKNVQTVLDEFDQSGIIRIESNRILLTDRERLTSIAEAVS